MKTCPVLVIECTPSRPKDPVNFSPARFSLLSLLCLGGSSVSPGAALPASTASFLENHCADCHDGDTKKGGLDLSALLFQPEDAKNFSKWVAIHDRVRDHEMPPKKKAKPEAAEAAGFLNALAAPLSAADHERTVTQGRSTWRRLNRFEYENAVRDLFDAPWLQLKDMLPEDGEAHRFNKVGDALDVSHVQIARYLGAADYALREVLPRETEKPEAKVVRYYARKQGALVGKMKLGEFNRSTERATFALLDDAAQVDVLDGKAPATVGNADPETRDREAVGVVASTYEPIEIRFDQFKAPAAGHYKLRMSAYAFWAGAQDGKTWWHPDRTHTYWGRRSEPVVIYSETKPRLLRLLGAFDVTPSPSVQALDVTLLAGETIRPDAARLFRSRPPNWHNPLAEPDGCPGVAFRWLEVEGPIVEQWPTAAQKLLCGDLALKANSAGVLQMVPKDAKADSGRLLRAFMAKAYRHPLADGDEAPFLKVIQGALDSGTPFTEAMIAGYSAVLCSPAFICLEEKPGRLDDHALAARLSFFLWNTAPDDELRALADRDQLRKPEVLLAQTRRLLADARSRRFINAFLDYWLDLRKANNTSPDEVLYPDAYLDDLLVDSALEESQLFFATLLQDNLPSRNVVSSDFAIVNERLAQHYGLPAFEGVALRRVPLPPESPRGGMMTMASVLKVTANGTSTSPVIRGAWIMERILGCPPPPPPPSVPAVEPDIRGATTIREQLAKHRTQETCNACHAKIDPAGFALENFDVIGGWRDHYRALGDGEKVPGFGKNGQPFAFHQGPPVDPSGELPDGRKFSDVRDLKRLLLADEKLIARNLARQLVIYSTGAPVRFGDRPSLEAILEKSAGTQFGVRSLIEAVVQSDLFQNK